MSQACSHLDQVANVYPSSDGCEDCLRIGGRWVHLRMCLVCGHVGCCDQSPNRHATKHFHATAHTIMRSFEPDEDWGWCYADELFFEPAPEPPLLQQARKAVHDFRSKLESILARHVRATEARIPQAMADEDLVNALAQYLDLEPLEKQALLEEPGIPERAASLVELLEMKLLMARTPGHSNVDH